MKDRIVSVPRQEVIKIRRGYTGHNERRIKAARDKMMFIVSVIKKKPIGRIELQKITKLPFGTMDDLISRAKSEDLIETSNCPTCKKLNTVYIIKK